MLHAVWTDEALADARGIVDYVSDRNPAAAERLAELFEQTAERLPERPYIHRPGRVPGTREAIVHPNYILVYRVGEAVIEIVAVLHARQQYPRTSDPVSAHAVPDHGIRQDAPPHLPHPRRPTSVSRIRRPRPGEEPPWTHRPRRSSRP